MSESEQLCPCGADDYNDRLGMDRPLMPHALNCPKRPNAAPNASEAPKVERQRACRCVAGFDGYCPQHGSSAPFLDPRERPAPVPEPKQGSEEPIDFVAAENYANSEWWKLHPPATVCDEREGNLARAHLALRAQLAAAQVEIKSLKFEKEAFREAHAEKARALAAAREEIAAWTKDSNDAREAFAAEKARADRAEERVMELEDLIAAKSEGDSYRDNDGCLPARLKGRSRYEAAEEAFEAEAERQRPQRGREPMRVQHRTVWIVEILVERKYENRYEATVGCSLTRDGAKELIKVWRANCPSDKFKIAKYRKEGR